MTAVHIGLFIVGSIWLLGIIPSYLLYFCKKTDEYEKYECVCFSILWPVWILITCWMWIHYKIQDIFNPDPNKKKS